MNSNAVDETEKSLNDDMRAANEFIIHYLENTMNDSRSGLKTLNRKLNFTYMIIIGFSIIMFTVGILLVVKPLFSDHDNTQLPFLAVGIIDLFLLFLFKPFDIIHGSMGDMSQIILALNSFQAQVGLRLMEMDGTKRDTIGQAAVNINMAAKDSIKLVQHYFETKNSTLGLFKSKESNIKKSDTPPSRSATAIGGA